MAPLYSHYLEAQDSKTPLIFHLQTTYKSIITVPELDYTISLLLKQTDEDKVLSDYQSEMRKIMHTIKILMKILGLD